VCGVKVSDTLSEFLNFPDLNLLMCGLLADCGNAAYTEGAAGAQVLPNVRVLESIACSFPGVMIVIHGRGI